MRHREVVIVPGTAENFDITTVQSGRIPLTSVTGTFTTGETVVQAVSGAQGVVYYYHADSKRLSLVEMSGTFDATNVITGNSSHATGTPTEVFYAFPNGIRLSAIDWKTSAQGDQLIVRHNNAAGPQIFNRRETTGAGGIHQAVGGRSLRVKPYISRAECVFDVSANVVIRLEYD